MKVTIRITKETTQQELLDLKKCIDALLEKHTPSQPEPKDIACIKKEQLIGVPPLIDPILMKGFLPIAEAHQILKVPKSVTWLYWKINTGEFSFQLRKKGSKKIMYVSIEDIKNYFSQTDHK